MRHGFAPAGNDCRCSGDVGVIPAKTGISWGIMKYFHVKKEYIFEDKRPFESCHASTLVVLSDGDVIAAWFGGTREGAGDVAIWCSRRIDGTWTAPVKLADQDGIPHWNPVLFQGEDEEIYLFYKVGHTIPKWQTMVMTSENSGQSWTSPRQLVEGDQGGRGPVKNKPIRLKSATWLAPASIESDVWEAFVDISHDRGNTWIKSQLVPVQRSVGEVKSPHQVSVPVPEFSLKGKGIIQPTLWESEPGIVHMFIRSTEGYIYRSDSQDAGQTWCRAYSTGLPNNNSGIDLTTLEHGEIVLVYNPVGENWGKRTPLVINISRDNGKTWGDKFILENEEGEFSYPAVVSRGNDIYLVYTWKRERIAFWRLSVKTD